MKKLLMLVILLLGSDTLAREVHIPEWRGYPPNRPQVCKTYLIRNDVYNVYGHYDICGRLIYREEVYQYSYYTREVRRGNPRRVFEN